MERLLDNMSYYDIGVEFPEQSVSHTNARVPGRDPYHAIQRVLNDKNGYACRGRRNSPFTRIVFTIRHVPSSFDPTS